MKMRKMKKKKDSVRGMEIKERKTQKDVLNGSLPVTTFFHFYEHIQWNSEMLLSFCHSFFCYRKERCKNNKSTKDGTERKKKFSFWFPSSSQIYARRIFSFNFLFQFKCNFSLTVRNFHSFPLIFHHSIYLCSCHKFHELVTTLLSFNHS